MDNRVRVLHVITGMGSGGAEMFLMNMYRNVDHEKIVFDFLLQSNENIYKKELASYGSQIWQIPPYFKHPMQNHAELKKILAQGYPIIHVHANALMYISPILLAEKAGVPCRIMHSHSTSLKFKWALPYHILNKQRVKKSATHRFACSEDAGVWMFGSGYTVIQNAIELDRFAFSPELREKYRKELGIADDALAIGQIGRLRELKNQSFSLEILQSLAEKKPNCRLLFVGDGPDEAELREKAQALGIAERVSFLGARTDVSDLMNAFDLLLFPSLYEGLGIVTVEAQANGLPVYCSNAIPDEALIGENIHRLSLEAGVDAWAKEILQADLNRRDNQDRLREAGYDIRYEAKKLQEFYLSVGNRG